MILVSMLFIKVGPYFDLFSHALRFPLSLTFSGVAPALSSSCCG